MKKSLGDKEFTMPAAATARAKKITVDIPLSLYKEAEGVLQERHITTSEFVRDAMEQYLLNIRQKKLDEELAEGYAAYAEISERIHNEFQFVDADQA